MGSKGQVTVFIILGIILLAIFSLFLFITGNSIEQEVTSASRDVVEDIPSEFIAVQLYTESCIESIATEGLILLGQQGGHLYPDLIGSYSSIDPTNQDGILLGSMPIPYWHYNSVANGQPNVAVASLMPSLDDADDYYSISNQLGRYVDEHLESCLQSFAPFQEQLFEFDYDHKETSVRIFDGELDVTTNMPLVVSRGESKAEMNSFYTEIGLDLKGYYELAKEIAVAQNNNSFLENHLLELIHVHSRVDPTALPPISSMLISSRPDHTSWNINQITLGLQSILTSNVPLIRYAGNKNFLRYEYDDEALMHQMYQQVYDNSVLPLASNQNYKLVSFSYLGWTPYVNLNGGESEISSNGFYSSSPFGNLPFMFGYQQYHNSYDVSFPVLVTVEDAAALDGQGYVFNFALESNLINNAHMDPEFNQAPVQSSGTERNLICNDNQKNSEMVTTIIIDSFTGETLSDVQIGLKVPGFDYCSMGETDNLGELESQYPLLYGGELDLDLDGYAQTQYLIDTYGFKEAAGIYGYAVEGIDYEVLEMHPLHEVDVYINVLPAKKCIVPLKCNEKPKKCAQVQERICFQGDSSSNPVLIGSPIASTKSNGSITGTNEYYFGGSGQEIDERMQVNLILTRVQGPNDKSKLVHNQFISVSSPQDLETIELIPGLYKVTSFVTMNDNVFISDDERCMYNEKRKGRCDMVSGMVSDNYMAGGFEYNGEVGYLEITPEDLYLSNSVTFTIPILDLNSFPATTQIYDYKKEKRVDINVLTMEDFTMANTLWESTSEKERLLDIITPVWQ